MHSLFAESTAEVAATALGAAIGETILKIADFTQYAAQSGQEIANFVDELNTTAQEARELSIALSLGVVSTDSFSRFIKGLDKRLRSAGTAGESARESLARFGVTLQDDEGQLVGYTEQLKRLAESYQTAKDAGMANEYLAALGRGAEGIREVLDSYESMESVRSQMNGLFY